ncbi:MAG: pyridoxal phosphate-dependent aminotransferase [Acidobacteriota bacterium]|nr:pyridoxal phosphate-dependent aminotransferase [Acidobacteriota bacterium]MDH3522020.1 pyridoxal phosphate-dependent aminotransferase [Acidobacteriota bacterium]
MPRFPEVGAAVRSMPGSVYSALARRLASFDGRVFPLHVGDTWMDPAVGCRMEDLRAADYPGLHRYAEVQGRRDLLEKLAGVVSRRTGLATASEDILVAAGATGALGAVAGAIVSPGDEVLLLAPYWPLIAGIVRSFGGTPVAVPFLGRVDSPETALEAVEPLRGERTIALYVNTPNNPTGRLLPASWLAALAEWCRRHDLWLISDEVYEDYVYGAEHAYTRPLAPERTFSAYSFSKAYGMAGNRCGYVVGPAAVMGELRKVSTHTFYSTPTAAQVAALRALELAGDWLAAARRKYAELGTKAAERLGVKPPDGSTFLFLDVAEQLDERGLEGFLEDCADRGLFLAPGPSFGPYPTHVRICFTAAEPEVVDAGVEVLAGLLGR